MANFDGTDAFFDSRDVIERIEELTTEFLDATGGDPADDMSADDWAFGLGEEGGLEITALIALRDEAECAIPDFEYGETFHTWDSLVEYAKEIVMETGYLPAETPSWITDNIDWEGVADDIKVDYTEFEFRGTTYYAR